MQDKFPVLLLYGLLGLLLALSPSLVKPHQRLGVGLSMRLPRMFGKYWLPSFGIVVAFILLAYTNTMSSTPFLFLLIGLSLGVAFLNRGSICDALSGGAGTLLACAVSATLPWWRRQQSSFEITNSEIVIFASLLIVAASVLLVRRSAKPNSRTANLFFIGIYSAITAYFSFSLASSVEPGSMLTLWHHWGAYIGPSELVLSGARLFHDIPAQYGAGPTLLLALACGKDCWTAAYWVIGVITFAYMILIGVIAWMLSSGGRYRHMLLLLACAVTCIFWIAYPPATSAPNVTPSTSGMRFLPAVMLSVWILFGANKSLKFYNIGGHTLWVIGALWSPESAFYVTAIWWSVYLFDCSAADSQGVRIVTALIRGFARLITLATGTIALVILGYYFTYGVFPVPRYFIAYMLYPPGPLPINPHGTIWYFGFAMALSVGVSWGRWKSSGDATRFRRSLTLQVLAFSVFSYYLGRSHDNNLLNLLPFVLLVLLDTFTSAVGVFSRHAAAFSLASLIAWLAVFGWQSWREAFETGHLIEFGFANTRPRLTYNDPATAASLAKIVGLTSTKSIDESSGLMEELSKRGESFTVLDRFFVLQPKYSSSPWSALHGPVNFTFIPSSMRREFLVLTAHHLGRDGWLVIPRDFDANSWLDDFDFAYERIERIDRNNAYAIKFAPKPLSGSSSN